jgi:hypothetical protein
MTLAALKQVLAPASRSQIEAWLAELSVRVIRRAGDQASDALTLRVYADALAKYPADVVRASIFNGWRYWPALDAELLPRCEERAEPRRWMLRALANWERPKPKAAPEPETPRPDGFMQRMPKEAEEALSRINKALGVKTAAEREIETYRPEPMNDVALAALLRSRVAAGMVDEMPDLDAYRATYGIPR